MINDIYVLKAYEGNLRKTYDQTGQGINVGTNFYPTKHEVKDLQDIQKLIELYRKQDGTHCFIRGNPTNEKFTDRRDKSIYDTAKNWACLDIDNLRVEEDEDYTAETLRKRLAREIDFINEDTAMVVDFSSSAKLTRKGEQSSPLWKAHIYLWFNEEISCKDLKERLFLGYKGIIDSATVLKAQPNYFEEPYYDEDYYEYTLTKRTSFLSGEQAKLPTRTPAPRISTRYLPTNSDFVSQTDRTEAFFKLTQTDGERYYGTHAYFCHIVATGQSQAQALNRVWESTGRSRHFDTKRKLIKEMQRARDFVYSKYLSQLDIGRHNLIETKTNNISEEITDIQGVILVKSPQATFKTQTLHKIPKEASCLLISHRVSLIRQICEEMGFHIYEDNKLDLHHRERLGITFDSLRELINFTSNSENITKRNYDYVIIDECEQVLGELLTTDRMMKATRQETSDVFHYVGQFIKNAKAVYVADADISDLTRLFLEIWRTDRFTIYDNKWNEEGKNLYLLPSLDSAIEQIYDELEANRRVFITCETKIGANTTKEQIELFDKTKNVLCITRDNKHKYKDLLNNPNKEFPLLFKGTSRINFDEFFGRKLDAFIVSPIMETGVSIGSRENNEHRFDTVIGIFNHPHKIFTGAKIRQALRRVRNADKHYAYIFNGNTEYEDIDEILAYIERLTPTNQPNNEINKLKNMVVRQTTISDANRILNVRALFETVGWNIKKAERDEKGAKEWHLIESKLRQEEIERLINANDITDIQFEFSAKDIDGKYERQKHKIKRCFYEGEIPNLSVSRRRPINETHIKRFNGGNIEKKYQLRDLLFGEIDKLDEVWKEIGDINYERFIKEQLEIVFNLFGFDFSRWQSNQKLTLFAFQIPDETAEYLFSEDNAKALSFLLDKWHNLPIQEKSKRLIDENKLRLFCKLAKLVDYDCKYIDKNNAVENWKDENNCSLTLAKVQRAIKEKIKKSKIISKKLKNKDLPPLTKQLIERADLNREKYLKNISNAICQNYEILEIEMDYLKQQYSHITLKDSTPRYTRFLATFIRRFSTSMKAQETAKNNNEKTSREGQNDKEDIYDL